jgi:hypothetical protein
LFCESALFFGQGAAQGPSITDSINIPCPLNLLHTLHLRNVPPIFIRALPRSGEGIVANVPFTWLHAPSTFVPYTQLMENTASISVSLRCSAQYHTGTCELTIWLPSHDGSPRKRCRSSEGERAGLALGMSGPGFGRRT